MKYLTNIVSIGIIYYSSLYYISQAMRKFKSIVIVYWILVIAGMAWGFLMLTGWSYPIDQVAKPLDECKSVHWDQMPDGCKIDLPKIVGGNSEAYKKDELYRLIYSDLWGGTYDDGRDTMSGSSPGIDIVTSKGTPVRAIGDGEVVQAWYKWGIGNSITIKHAYKGWYIYSSYSHLDEMYVQVWDSVKEWKLIGKVGNTWTTYGQYGNHLDFQITTTTQRFYPYSYHDCNQGLSYYDIINSAVCRSYMLANTMDPIALLESANAVWAIKAAADRVKNDVDPAKVATTASQKPAVIPISPAPTSISDVHAAAPVIQASSKGKKYQYQVIWLQAQESIEVKRKFVFFIKIYDVSTKQLYKGRLAHHIVIRDSKGLIAFDRPVVTSTTNGIVKVTALGLKAWYTDLNVEVAGNTLGTYGVTLS
jgi:hypothetical protein